MMPSPSDLVQLASNLREEHIFVRAETQQLSRLNKQLAETTESLYHQAWIARTQRRALELLLAQRQDLPPDRCFRRLNAAVSTVLVDGYRVLGYKESSYGECLKVVRENPELLAECLVRGERNNPEKMQEALRTVFGSLYGYGLIPEDQEYSLKLLKSLIEIQLDANSNPRRLLQKVSTFSYAYKVFVENLHETKLYLAAALHQPILQALAEDDVYLDIDPKHLTNRFTAEEKKRRFGEEGTERYNQNFKEYRSKVVLKLVRLAHRFIHGLIDSLFCFPPSLCWIISQVYERIQSQQPAQSTLPAVVCTDLIFSHFLCLAIIEPEPYALTSDIPVSHTARWNLNQVAQLLQTLAVSKWETIDPQLMDVYGAFEPGCMWKLLDQILEMRTSDILAPRSMPPDCLKRSSVFMSVSELNFLVGFLKDTSADRPGSRVPSDIFRKLVIDLTPIEVPQPKENGFSNGHSTPTDVSKTKLKHSLSKSFDVGRYLTEDNAVDSPTHMLAGHGENSSENQVMVISLGPKETEELGFLSEQKVMALSKRTSKKRTRFSEDQDSFEVGSVDDEAMSAFSVCSSIPESVSGGGHGKRNSLPSRFDDTNSMPSDGLLAVCEEGRGSHSIASSVDGTAADDNLSDDVSASVSGRASPSVSVSGRDTPSPQNEHPNLDLPPVQAPHHIIMNNRPIGPRDLPVTVQKINREDVPEKFGKFYIPMDETRSTMSDAWSTEVAASEVEGLNEPVVPPVAELLPLIDDPVFAVAAAGGFDSDDDRWSVDVAASVSNASQEPLEDRMAELENEPEGDPDLLNQHNQLPLANPHFSIAPPVLPNAPGKYVSFANDAKFHHYPPESDHLFDGYGTLHENLVNDLPLEEEDPTANLPLNVFLPMPVARNSMGGSVPSSCSSFSNLSGFSSFESENSGAGLIKLHGLEESVTSTIVSSFNPFAPAVFDAGPESTLNAQKPPVITRKGSLGKEVGVLKDLPVPNRPHGLRDGSPLSTARMGGPSVSISSSYSYSQSNGKKGGFLKSIATSFRGKQKRMSSKVDVPPNIGTGNGLTPLKNGELSAAVESPDDILAKYRKKPATGGNLLATMPVDIPLMPQQLGQNLDGDAGVAPLAAQDSRENLCIADFAGIGDDVMLETAKRKVRIVLSSFDTASASCLKMRLINKNERKGSDPALLSFLKIQLSEAVGLQDRSLMAQLHEAIRCVKALDGRGIRRLIEALKNDSRNRNVYTDYLIRCRKMLLNSLQNVDNLTTRTKRDGSVCSKFFISVCVGQFLEKRIREVKHFVASFQRLSLFDEKTALVESFLMRLYSQMESDNLWRICTPEQIVDARETLERQIMSQIYLSALYPNQDVDRMRDQVLYEHIHKLAGILTPDHKDLKIAKVYHLECPWPSAQAEIAEINAYKTPKDKVLCVVRCSVILMNLLSLAADSSVPAADDFMPALVYVLIRANPPGLLSTVQYVNNFYGNRLAGEESYWWTQFASAIEYIKNMDYMDESNGIVF